MLCSFSCSSSESSVPIGMLYFLNWRSARFRKSDLLRIASIGVTVSPSAVIRTEAQGGGPVRATTDEFRNFPGTASPSKQLACGPLRFSARTALSPVTPPYGEVTSGNQPVVTSESNSSVATTGRVPLELRGTWVFVVNTVRRERADDPVDEGEGPATEGVDGVLYLLAAHPIEDQSERMLLQVERDLPPLEAHLAAAIYAVRQPASSEPGAPSSIEDERSMPDIYGDPFAAEPSDVPNTGWAQRIRAMIGTSKPPTVRTSFRSARGPNPSTTSLTTE